MRELHNFFIVLGAELKRLFAYRVQFWFEVIASSIVEIGVALVVWRAVFEALQTPSIGGYTFDQMVVYVVVATFISYAMRGTGMGTFARDIYDGSYTRYLIYPVSVLSYKYATFFARTVVALCQLYLALAIMFAIGALDGLENITPLSILVGTLMAVLASWVYFLLLLIIESIAFWVDQAWAVSYMLQIVVLFFSGKLIPIGLFPAAFAAALQWTPFPALVFGPTKVLLGDYSLVGSSLLALAIWGTVLIFILRAVIRRGTLQYSGVGI